jgi:hypothetical protein
MGTKYVVLVFEDGDRFDYEPPLPHPADVFLDRFGDDRWLNADLGAAGAYETASEPEPSSDPIKPPD